MTSRLIEPPQNNPNCDVIICKVIYNSIVDYNSVFQKRLIIKDITVVVIVRPIKILSRTIGRKIII